MLLFHLRYFSCKGAWLPHVQLDVGLSGPFRYGSARPDRKKRILVRGRFFRSETGSGYRP